MVEDFWERVARYKEMGLDPLRWVAGCAVKVDLTTVVYPALRKIRPQLEQWGVTLNSREDADIFPRPKEGVEFERRVYDPKDPKVDAEDLRRIRPVRAISLVQVYQRNAETPESFANILSSVYSRIGESGVRFIVGKGHSIITAYPDAEFTLFDFLTKDGTQGRSDGWALANNDTIQVIDPTDDPGSEAQAFVGLSNALNDLIALGAEEKLAVFPVIDAPNDDLYHRIESHMKTYCSRYGMTFKPAEKTGKGNLLIGATVSGEASHELPTFHRNMEEGMGILVSRPFGDLAPITSYLACLADSDYVEGLKEYGLSMEELEGAKSQVIETMKKPNLEIAHSISRYCPSYGGKFDVNEHIADTVDVSGPGIYVFKEIAEAGKVHISLDRVPLSYDKPVLFATKNYLMDNATAGTNGAIAIIASQGVLDEVEGDLRKAGYRPEVIGRVVGHGEGKVSVGPEVEGMISSKSLLEEFTVRKVN